MMTQIPYPQYNRRQSPRRSALIAIAIQMTATGTIVCILNIIGIIGGPWSSVLGVSFTALSLMLALVGPISFSVKNNYKDTVLIVKVKNRPGFTDISLGRGFDVVNLKTDVAKPVCGYDEDGHTVYAAVFDSLKPGNYTVHANFGKYVTKMTISP